jgi:beta-glucosidase
VLYNVEKMVESQKNGEFPEKDLDENIRRILRAMFRVGLFEPKENLPKGELNTKAHQELARKIAEDGIVLLKNDYNILPLNLERVKKVCVLGRHADIVLRRKKLGGGSSLVYPPYEVTIRQGLENKLKGKVTFVSKPEDADVAFVCVGLEHTHDFKGGDHEGSDRLRYGLGRKQNKLIESTLTKNPNTVVIMVGGQPSDIEKFIDKVPGFVEAWLGGMEMGNAVAKVISGEVNPSGKLPITWVKTKKDIPTAFSFIKNVFVPRTVVYDEGIYVGYRYYETKKKMDRVRFPFGFGMSYTTFEFSDLVLNTKELSKTSTVSLSFNIKNTGKRDGAEVGQMYITDNTKAIDRPDKELKRFKKVFLKAGESKKVTFDISYDDLCYWDVSTNNWNAKAGEYTISVGSSSQDIRLSGKIKLQ